MVGRCVGCKRHLSSEWSMNKKEKSYPEIFSGKLGMYVKRTNYLDNFFLFTRTNIKFSNLSFLLLFSFTNCNKELESVLEKQQEQRIRAVLKKFNLTKIKGIKILILILRLKNSNFFTIQNLSYWSFYSLDICGNFPALTSYFISLKDVSN